MSDASPAEAQSFTARMAMWSARHRKAVALAWVAIVIVAIGTCTVVPTDTDIEQEADYLRAVDLVLKVD